jgi:hypothetical protein
MFLPLRTSGTSPVSVDIRKAKGGETPLRLITKADDGIAASSGESKKAMSMVKGCQCQLIGTLLVVRCAVDTSKRRSTRRRKDMGGNPTSKALLSSLSFCPISLVGVFYEQTT